MSIRRLLGWLAAALTLAIIGAPAAGADPARPGNYRSQVLWIRPATDVVTAKVVGGDGFLDLSVRAGHRVEIPGYTGEPWLRIDSEGTVWENQASSATYLNETRYGTAGNTQIPGWITIEGATRHPQWKVVGHGGRYVWHDHRIHYMTPNIAPPLVPGTNRVAIGIRTDGRWVVPLTVDGTATQIVGELRYTPPPSALPQWALAAVLCALLALAGFVMRAASTRVAGIALVITGALAILAGASELAAVPTKAGGNPIWVALPIVTLIAAAGVFVLRSAALRSILLIAAGAALGVWAVLRVPAFDKSVPLGTLDPTLTRLIAAGALGVAAGSIIVAIASGGLALRLPQLDDDEQPGTVEVAPSGEEPVDR